MKQIYNLKDKIYGSYTLEAAFIFPIVIFVIVLFIYVSFLLHDRSCIAAIMNQGIQRLNFVSKYDGDLGGENIYYNMLTERNPEYFQSKKLELEKKKLSKAIFEHLQSKLLFSEVHKIEIHHEVSSIKISVHIQYYPFILSIGNLINMKEKHGYRYQLQSKGEINNPSEFIRMYESLNGIVKGEW